MRRSIRVAAVVAALFLVLPAAAVQAGAPRSVHFDIQTTLNEPSFGPFTASGVAVTDGLMCPAGDTVDLGLLSSGGQSRNGGLNFLVYKQFTCTVGPEGMFVLKLQVRVDPNRGSSYSWLVVSGTGAYERLRGSGTGYGVESTDTFVHDILFGTVFVR